MGNFWNATHTQSFVLISLLLIAQESWSHSNFIVQGLTWLPKVTGNQRQSYIIAFLCYSLRHIIDFYPFSWLCCEWQFGLSVTVEEQGALLTCHEMALLEGRRGRTRHAWRGFIRGETSCLLQTSDSTRTTVINPTPVSLHMFMNPHMYELLKSGHLTHPHFVHWDLCRLACEVAEFPVCCDKCPKKCASPFLTEYQCMSKECMCVLPFPLPALPATFSLSGSFLLLPSE